jgi:hypothetical protein
MGLIILSSFAPLRLCAFARDIFSSAEEGLAQRRKDAKEDRVAGGLTWSCYFNSGSDLEPRVLVIGVGGRSVRDFFMMDSLFGMVVEVVVEIFSADDF